MKNKTVIYVLGFLIVIIFYAQIKKNNLSSCHIYHTDLNMSLARTHFLIDKNNYYSFGSLIIADPKTNANIVVDTVIAIKNTYLGNEKKWDFFGPKLPGKCSYVAQTPKNLYIIGHRNYTNLDTPYHEYKLYRISKKDGKYEELYQWKEKNCYLRSMYFTSDKNASIFYRPTGNPFDSQLYWTNDGGKHWQYRNLNRPVIKTHLFQNKLYFLSHKCCNNLNNWIYSMQMDGSHLDSLQFDIDITDFAVDEKGFWLLGQDTTRTKTGLWHYDNKNEKLSAVKIFVSDDKDFFPTRIYKYNELLVIFISRIDKGMLLGLGGTRPYMFISKDKGKTWHKFYSSNVFNLEDGTFYKDKRMIAYIMPGEIFICNFDEKDK